MLSQYRSTRLSQASPLLFEEVVMTGLAPDGGLYLPLVVPTLPADFLTAWLELSFPELAKRVMRMYIAELEIPDAALADLVDRLYATFRSSLVTPVVELDAGKNLHLLELFHGPTYAFKDVALQFVGNLFEFFLTRRNEGKTGADRELITVVGATSGDTGSAAIYGLRGKKDVEVFILYPTGRILPIQEAQMTTVEDANVHTLSVKGTFDDCQDIVKQVFGDKAFNDKYHIGAVNSINWARILAQITYYFYAYFQVARDGKPVHFVVPLGNFGDILAGYFAKQMGLPIGRLVIATNANDILDRFMKTGRYETAAAGAAPEVHATDLPAMDILILSNFERLLWYLVRDNAADGDDNKAGETLAGWMAQLKQLGSVTVPEAVIAAARRDFALERVLDAETRVQIADTYHAHPDKYVLDPHSAVGVAAAYRQIAQLPEAVHVLLATAHPAKFADVVNAALDKVPGYSFEKDVLPEELRQLETKVKRVQYVERADVELVKQAIVDAL